MRHCQNLKSLVRTLRLLTDILAQIANDNAIMEFG